MTDADLQIMRDAVARHKQDRDVWHSGIFHRIRTVDKNLLGALCVSQDRSSARLVLAEIDRPRSTVPPRILIPDLEPDQFYRVKSQFMTEQVKAANRSFNNPLFNGGLEMTGRALQTFGIGLPSLYAQTGLAIAFDAIEPMEVQS